MRLSRCEAAALAALLLLSLALRTRALDAGYWIDEGLSVGIASHELSEIPGLLRQDGSPPLYYLLLHGWMALFGSGEEATHALSLLAALATVPAALWAGRSLLGPRAGWLCALLAATNPFITAYAQETRMYALVMLLSILAAAAFLHAFVLRDRRFVAIAAALLTLLLYTHNWGLFLAVGAVAALAACALAGADRRGVARDGALALGAAGVLYLPWLPTLLHQASHTGAPWSSTPSVAELAGAVTGPLSLGAVALLSWGRPALPRHAAGRAATGAAVLLAVTVLTAWLAAHVEAGWANRYLAVVVGPLLLVLAYVLGRLGRAGLVVAAAVAAAWALSGEPAPKSNARELAARLAPSLGAGDVVLSAQPEQVPVLAHYLPRGVRFATPLGPVADPAVMDWQDAVRRLRATPADEALDRALETTRRSGRLVLVQPLVVDPARWRAPWTSLVLRRSEALGRLASSSPQLVALARLPANVRDAGTGMTAVVYRRAST